jgi:hypothetical protein
MSDFLSKYKWAILGCAAVFVVMALIELMLGSKFLGRDGVFGWWEGDVFSPNQSQTFFDPYSFSHIIHGIISYAFLWLLAPKLPLRHRLILTLLVAAAWEIGENSPFIVNRYRRQTASFAYAGDSVINSLSDLVMVVFGFLLAWRARVWASVTAVIAIEVGMLLLVRDCLVLNAIMLIYKVPSIRSWQLAG